MRPVFPAAVLAALFFVPAAGAWTWPAAGPVVQPFSFDPAHPYAAGQHRGVDIAGDSGTTVVAPEGGSVSFAGTVPSSGKSVTILTADGYAVTLTHLGSVVLIKGAAVAEGDAVGTIGPSGDPEVETPYVHLGVRVATDQEGYLDPAGFLPDRVATTPPSGAVPSPAPPPTTPTTGDAPTAPAAPVAAAVPAAPAGAPVAPADPVSTTGPAEAPVVAPAAMPPPSPRAAAFEPAQARPPVPRSARTAARGGAPAQQPAPQPGPSRALPVAPAVGTAVQQTTHSRPLSHPARSRHQAAVATGARHATSLRTGLAPLRPGRAAHSSALRGGRVPVAADPRRPMTTGLSRPREPVVPVSSGDRRRPDTGMPGLVVVAGLGVFAVLGAALLGLRRRGRARPVRMIAANVEPAEEDLGGACVAVCSGAPAPWPRGGVRRSVRRLRPLPPPQGERRPHGQRNGRARYAGDGDRRSRGEVLR